MLRRVFIAATAVAAAFAIYPAQAQSGSYVLKRIKERGVVNMGHRESSVPFS